MRRALELFAALTLSACVGGGASDGGLDASVPSWTDGTLSLGGRDVDGGFTTLPAESTGEPGSQGGYHVSVMYRVTGESLASVLFEHRVTRTRDGTLVSKGSRTFDVLGDPWTTERGVIVFLCPTPVGVDILGEELTFQVTASKGGSLLGTSSATTVFRCTQGDAFCASICRG